MGGRIFVVEHLSKGTAMPLEMKWKPHFAEYVARTVFDERHERYICEWRAYRRSYAGWALGLSVGRTGTHIPLCTASTLQELKNRALCAAAELFHQTAAPWDFDDRP